MDEAVRFNVKSVVSSVYLAVLVCFATSLAISGMPSPFSTKYEMKLWSTLLLGELMVD